MNPGLQFKSVLSLVLTEKKLINTVGCSCMKQVATWNKTQAIIDVTGSFKCGIWYYINYIHLIFLFPSAC